MILMVILTKKARGRKGEQVVECLRNLEDMNLMAIPS